MPNEDYILRRDALGELYRGASEQDPILMISHRVDLCERIEKIPAADVEPKQRWIPVKERLPENGKYVLAYSADDDYTTIEARHKFEVFQITHRMPLPEPPKEEEDGI